MGQKHLIECHCILPIYKETNPPVYHKFPVFSVFDDNEKIIPKYVKCTNCETIHYVYELCKSEIKIGNEDAVSVRNKNDVILGLPDKVVRVLKEHECNIEVYEQTEYILENKLFPESIIIKRDIINDSQSLKLLQINSEDKFKIINEIIESVIVGEQ